MFRMYALVGAVLIVLFGLTACRTAEEATMDIISDEVVPAPVTPLNPDESVTSGVGMESAQDQIEFEYGNPILQVMSNAFSPNGDGYRDELEFYVSVPTTRGFSGWVLVLLSEGNSEIMRLHGDTLVPGRFTWDGNTPSGRPVADGWYYGRLFVDYNSGKRLTANSSRILLWREGPTARIIVPPGYFSPDDDGVNDTITLHLDVDNPDDIVSYQVSLYNSRDSLFDIYAAPGAPPAEFTWDGKNRAGDTVESAEDYRLELRLRDKLGNISIVNATIPVDILVYRSGDQVKIRIAAITFLPYSDNYLDVAPMEREKNLATLDRLAEILKKFSGYTIEIQGHAVMIYWNDPVRGENEQREVLVPLSKARADAIRLELIARGIQADRMTTTGVGAMEPLVPFSNLENRWMDRRVEFILRK